MKMKFLEEELGRLKFAYSNKGGESTITFSKLTN